MILQIVPEPPTVLGGVRAYAERLHALDPDRLSRPLQGTQQALAAMHEQLSNRHRGILLHYVNYGFDPGGRPHWLAENVERLARGGLPIIVFFHEVFASGPPWTRAFWTSRAQQSIARRTAQAARFALTSLPLYETILRRLAPELQIEVLPVLSPIGEPERTLPLADRAPHLVVFGSRGLRLRAYARHGARLSAVCRELGISRVVDIGEVDQGIRAAANRLDVAVEHRGILTDDQVSHVLQQSRAGFLAYPPAFLGKSTVYAAFASHRLLPICEWAHQTKGACATVPYCTQGAIQTAGAQTVADAAHAWYTDHCGPRQLMVYRRVLGLPCAS